MSSQFDSLLSNDLQFAYKLHTSTMQCVSYVIETVSYYIDHLGVICFIHICACWTLLKRSIV